MKLIQRISHFILSQPENQEKSGLNRKVNKSINEEIAKTGSLSAEKLEEICNRHPHLNPIWLLTGKGEMLIDDYHEIGKAYDNVDSEEGIYNVIAGKDIEIQLLKEHIEGLNELIKEKNNLIDEYRNG